MKLLEALAELFWGLALCAGVVLFLSLFLGVMAEARHQQGRKRARYEEDGDPWSI